MKKYITQLKIVVLALMLSWGIGFVFAQWTGPTASFPNGNTERPINVGADLQTKAGSLWANFLGSDTGFYAQGNAEIGGTLTVGGGSPGADKFLVSKDSSGLSRWADLNTVMLCTQNSKIVSGSSATISCSKGEVVSGGGGSCASGSIKSSIPTSGSQDGWELSCSSPLNTVTIYAICCGVDFLMTAEPGGQI